MKTLKIFLPLLFFACTSNENTEVKVVENVEMKNNDSDIKTELGALNGRIGKAVTADSLFVVFDELLSIQSKLNEQMRLVNADDKVTIDSCRNIVETLPFLKMVWIEEGTVAYFTIDNNKIVERAKLTKGNEDDDYFLLLKDLWGAQGDKTSSFPIYIDRSTCLSGYSLLGDSVFTNLLIKVNDLHHSSDNIVVLKAEEVYREIVADLLDFSNYGNPKEKVLKEWESILNSNLVTPSDKEKMKEGKGQFDAKDVQYNCKAGGCVFE